MADSSPLLVWVVDPAGRVNFVNRAYYDFFGIAPAALKEGGWTPLVHPDDESDYVGEVQSALAGQRSFSAMARVQRSDGEWRWCSRSVRRDSTPTAFLGSGQQPGHHRAGRRVGCAARSRSSQGRIPRNSRTSCAIRSPHPPGGAPVAFAAGDRAQRRWSQEVIERQVQHMALLLDDLLDVSRITRGKLELKRQRVQLASVVETALETARPLLDERRQRVTTSLPAGPVWLDADPLRLAQILANLLTNAAKYSESGGRVDLRASLLAGRLSISVRDTGIGIEAELLPRVFEMFSQVKGSLDRAEGGLGIGLALVRNIVNRAGGEIVFEPSPSHQGLAVTVRFPV
jgi:PAS domain S-box-containing protein